MSGPAEFTFADFLAMHAPALGSWLLVGGLLVLVILYLDSSRF